MGFGKHRSKEWKRLDRQDQSVRTRISSIKRMIDTYADRIKKLNSMSLDLTWELIKIRKDKFLMEESDYADWEKCYMGDKRKKVIAKRRFELHNKK